MKWKNRGRWLMRSDTPAHPRDESRAASRSIGGGCTARALRPEVALRQARGVGAVRGEAVRTEADHRGHGDNQHEDSKDRRGHHARNERIAPPPSLEARRDFYETDWIDPRELHSGLDASRAHLLPRATEKCPAATQHILVFRLQRDMTILTRFQALCQGPHFTESGPVAPSARRQRHLTGHQPVWRGRAPQSRAGRRTGRRSRPRRGKSPVRARAVRSDRPAPRKMSQEQT